MRYMKLQTKDKHIFDVELELALMSDVLMDMYTICGEEGNDGSPIILGAVTTSALILFLKWAEFHRNDKDIKKAKFKREKSCKWDDIFISELSEENLYELMQASNYLNIDKLRSSVAKGIAKYILKK